MKIIIIAIFISFPIKAQWLGGAGYQQKSSVPEKGAALFIINKLPIQFPAAGFNFKGKLSYFFSGETPLNFISTNKINFREFSGDVFLETNFFTRLFQPYLSLGFGGGIISASEIERGFFSVSGDVGIKILYEIQPFLGLQVRKLFPEDIQVSGVNIKSLHVMGMIGVLFSI